MSRPLASWVPKIIVACSLAAALAACSANSGPPIIPVVPSASLAAAPVIKFALSPTSISQGQSAVATWSTSGATSCAGNGAWTGALALSNTGDSLGPLDAAGTYTYGVTCVGAGGTTAVNQTLMVGAVPAPTIRFSVSPLTVQPGNPVTITWSTTNATACAAAGGTGSDGWSGTQPVDNATGFTTTSLTAAGSYAYALTCSGGGGTSEQDSIVTVSSAAPPPPPSLIFTAQPSIIQPGQTASFSWTAGNAATCTASGGSGADGWSGVRPTSSTGTSIGPIATIGTYSYTLTCSGPGGSFASSVTVAVNAAQAPPVPTVILDVTPTQIVAGASAALSWSSTNSDACTASGSWSGGEPVQGSAVSAGSLTVAGIYTYTLTCAGIGGSTNDTAQLTVVPAPAAITSFAATPNSIAAGQSTVLAWTSSSDATSCAATGGSGADNWVGAVSTSSSGKSVGPINVAGTYVYTLTCIGAGGVSPPRSATVTVSPAVLTPASVSTLTASPSTLPVGQAATLAWSSNGATSCTATGGTGSDSWNGSVGTASTGTTTGPIATAGNYQYTLTCAGPGGTGAPSSVFLNVTSATPGAAVVATFDASPSTAQVGQFASLSWSSSNATHCAATGGTGADGWNGLVGTASAGTSVGPFNAAGPVTYTLTCTGPAGVGPPSSLLVNVTSTPPPPASVTSFTATPSSLQTGQSTSLAWSSSNATGCTASGGSGADTWNGGVAPSSNGTIIGPLSAPGNYTYTLTCAGPGGTGMASSIAVNVASTPPVPTIGSFTATPSTVQTGGSTTLAWWSTDATSCAATGGTGSDGWSGSAPTSSSGFSVGPIAITGTVSYTLTCNNAGGASAPSSVSVTVSATAPPAMISSFGATPGALQTGQASQLTWSAANATSCAASGGTGSDGWHGVVASSGTASTGPIGTPATYVYTLTCTGPGGSSAPSNAAVAVTNTTPPASIATFTAAPAILQVGQSTQLAWTTNGASACTASGGNGTDSWSGTKPVSSSGTPIGPINTAGNYIYTLICTGPGGQSNPSSLSVVVNTAPAPAAITSFTATPSSVQSDQSTSLAWTTTAATSCTASGGTGTDGWTGSLAPSNSGWTIGPLIATGTVTYTLTCTGPGGSGTPVSTHVSVTAAVPGQPTVALLANGTSPATAQPGTSPVLSWTSTSATSCAASGGTGSDGWTGSKPGSSSGVAIGPLSTPGIYSYTLTCSGPGGSGSSTVQITIVPSTSSNCGAATPTASLVSPTASASTAIYHGLLGLQCLGCSVSNAANVIDASTTDFASLSIPVGLLGGSATLRVTDSTAVFPAGRQAGFVISEGTSLLSLSLLSGISLTTRLNGTVQETATSAGLLTLQALGLLSVDPFAGYVEFTTSKPFNSVEVTASSAATLLTTYKVYDACVSLQ